jgi:signal transduction histidine kinase
LGHERALITLNPYETQQLIEALQKTQGVTNKKRRGHILDFIIFLMKKGLFIKDKEGSIFMSKALIKDHLEDLALNTIAGKGMAVGGVQAEVAQVEIDTELR